MSVATSLVDGMLTPTQRTVSSCQGCSLSSQGLAKAKEFHRAAGLHNNVNLTLRLHNEEMTDMTHPSMTCFTTYKTKVMWYAPQLLRKRLDFR